FNENSRVKLPSILHLQRLSYEYLSLKNAVYNSENNIFTDIFKQTQLRDWLLPMLMNGQITIK
ncbi:MAG: hypothetical protein ACKPE1_08965, partial [Dolichospermum sp.]